MPLDDKVISANARFGEPVQTGAKRVCRYGQNPVSRESQSDTGVGGVVGSKDRLGDKGHLASERATADQLAQHVNGLRRYALLLIGNSVDADDLVQETLSKVLAQLQRWNEVRDLRSYMFTALHNVYIDHTRRHAKLRHSVPIDEAVSILSTPATQQKRLELRDLSVALSKLPIEQREVVLLVGFEGMSYGEAASALGIPIGTVMSRLSRGREALRQMTNRNPQAKLRVVK